MKRFTKTEKAMVSTMEYRKDKNMDVPAEHHGVNLHGTDDKKVQTEAQKKTHKTAPQWLKNTFSRYT